MKQKLKNKNIRKLSTKKRSKLASQAVALACAKHQVLRHFRLVSHKHTGKLIHHRHTSHMMLVVILLIVGVFLYASGYFADAISITKSQTVSVTAVVPETASNVGEVATPLKNDNIINKDFAVWFETPVPLYLMILMLTLGFWGGDIFNRKFGTSKNRHRV